MREPLLQCNVWPWKKSRVRLTGLSSCLMRNYEGGFTLIINGWMWYTSKMIGKYKRSGM